MQFKLEDFIKLSQEKKEIRHFVEKVNNQNLHIFHYMIATTDLFKTEIERECRGVVFNDDGVCICRPFHKFFNIGEKEETLPENINWQSIKYISSKIDGSLVTPVIIDDKIFWKTKKSFYSEIACKIQKAWDNKERWIYKYNDYIQLAISNFSTPLFEYISPDNRIVIDYGQEEQLISIGSRSMDTGKYFLNKDICNFYYSNFLKEKQGAYKYFIENIKETPLIEGYVLYTEFGENIYKIKTQWYLDRHHLLSSLSYREIIKMIAEEKIDDIISELRLKGFINQIKIIENIIDQYSQLRNHEYYIYHELYNNILSKFYDEKIEVTRKEFALKISKTSYVGILFAMYDDRQDQVEKLIQKNITNHLIEVYKNKKLFLGTEI